MALNDQMATHSFGPFRLNTETEMLFHGTEPISLGRRAVRLLRVLVERSGTPVSKDALIEAAWSGLAVEDSNLTVQIAALRRALGEEPGGESWIETLPRRGYRFAGPQASLVAESTSDAAAYPALPDKPSIAVLPFQNMSNETEGEFFADGIAEDIITALSHYPSLFVIARNSSFVYKHKAVNVKEVGRELGVRYILEGSLRKSKERIRVTAQLVEAEAGRHIWADQYDRVLADIFAVQDEITQASTIAIAPAIAAAELQRAIRKTPERLDAWSVYQRGLWHLGLATKDDNSKALQLFQNVIDRDPNFSAGYVGLALALFQAAVHFQVGELRHAQQSAETLATRAIALDSTNAQAHACLANALRMRGDLPNALGEAQHALAICPNLANGHGEIGTTLVYFGQPTEGLRALQTSIRLDPRDPQLAWRLNWLGVGYYFARQYESAIEAAQRALRSCPTLPMPYRWIAASLGQLGRTEEAREALAKAITIGPASFELFVRRRVPWHRPDDYAHMMDGLRKAGWSE